MSVKSFPQRAFASLFKSLPARLLAVFGFLFITTAFSFNAFAATIVVDDDSACTGAAHTTIQSAVTAANPGDTIEICSGTYPISSTISLNKAGLTLIGTGATKPVVQIPTTSGNGFNVSAANVTLDNLEIQKTNLGSPHELMYISGNDFTLQNSLIYGPYPGTTWSASGLISRGFVTAGGITGLLIQNNTIHTLRQPAYLNPGTVGTITNNNVSGTRGWVVDAAKINFTGNTFGPPANQGSDIALLSNTNPADYPDLAALSANNDNAAIDAQYAGGVDGSSVTYVDDSAPAGGIGTVDAPYQTIQQGVNGTYNGGTVNVAAGTYPEYVSTNKNLTFLGPQAGIDARTGRTTPSAEAVVGIASGAFNLQVNPGTTKIDGFTLTGANSSNGDGAALLLIGGSGHQIINNIFQSNQRGAFFSSTGTTFKRNRVNNTFDGFFGGGDGATIEENSFTGAYPDGAVNTTNGTQSNNYKIINNSFNATGNFAVVFNTNNGQVSGNTVTGTASSAVFIGGGNSNLLVAENNIFGNTSSAISLSGGFGYQPDSNITIKSNNLINNLRGVNVGTGANSTTGIEGHFNRIVGNSIMGINNASTASVNAENNWWGCNYGPGATGTGCSGTTNGITGNVDANPWLTLTSSANPGTIITGTTSSITSKLTINSDNVDTSAAGTVPNGIPVAFTATLGTVSPTSNTTASGITGTTYTAGAVAGTGGVQTNIDGQTVNAPVNIIYTCNNVAVQSASNVPRNTQFTVPVTVDNTTGRGIISYQFSMNYDPSVITFIGTDTVGTLSSGWTITSSSSSGVLNINGFNTAPLTGSGVLLNLRFISTSGIGTMSGLNFTSFQFNEGVPCANTTNGNVTVISGTISGAVKYANAATTMPVPNTTLNAAGSTPLSTTTNANGLYTLSGFGAGAYTVTPSKANQVNGISNFDASRTAQHVAGLVVLNSTQLTAADVSGNGNVTAFDAALIAQYVANISNPGSTGTWRFTPVNRSYPNAESNHTDQDYNAILMGEVTGNWDPTGPLAPNFSEESESVAQENLAAQPEQVVTVNAPLPQNAALNTNFVIPITASNTTGEGIIGYEFDLVYDKNVIMPQANPCDLSGTISSSLTPTCNGSTPGLLKVVVFGTMPTTGAGTLIKLNFTAIGTLGSTSPLNFQNFMFNEGQPQDVTTNGQVLLATSPTAASVNISGRVSVNGLKGLGNARVYLTDNNGETRSTMTNSLGYYRFADVQVGASYTMNVLSKRYTFAPQIVTVSEEMTNLHFVAQP